MTGWVASSVLAASTAGASTAGVAAAAVAAAGATAAARYGLASFRSVLIFLCARWQSLQPRFHGFYIALTNRSVGLGRFSSSTSGLALLRFLVFLAKGGLQLGLQAGECV